MNKNIYTKEKTCWVCNNFCHFIRNLCETLWERRIWWIPLFSFFSSMSYKAVFSMIVKILDYGLVSCTDQKVHLRH